jgi:hypothetical protein
MKAYDENWKNIQNRIAENTSQFLEERINEIRAELGDVDNSIASYKGSNLMPDASAAQSMYMSQSSSTQASIQNYNTQLSLLRYVRSYLLGNMGSNRPLPSQQRNSGCRHIRFDIQLQHDANATKRNGCVCR